MDEELSSEAFDPERRPEEDLFAPIPLEIPDTAGYQSLEIKENGEPLVAVGPFSGNDFDRFFTSSIYYGERQDSPYGRAALGGSLVTTFVREGAAKQLLKAEDLLPDGYHLVVLDTYRSPDVQQSLYKQYADPLRRQHPDWSEEQIVTEATKYVSKASTDPAKPATHNTGGSVDLAIYKLPKNIDTRVKEINDEVGRLDQEGDWQEIYKLEMERIGLIAQNAELLDFGTQFDWGGPEAALNYYEKQATERRLTPEEEEATRNRRLLYNVMTRAGYEPFISEWWHYNSPNTQMGAKTAGLPYAGYGAAELSSANMEHERMRRQHIRGTEMISALAEKRVGERMISLGKQLEVFGVLVVAQDGEERLGGDYNVTNLPKAAIIKPPEEKAA